MTARVVKQMTTKPQYPRRFGMSRAGLHARVSLHAHVSFHVGFYAGFMVNLEEVA
jgi:hypothetical protein